MSVCDNVPDTYHHLVTAEDGKHIINTYLTGVLEVWNIAGRKKK